MDLDDLTKAAFSIIEDDDPYKESKQLQIRNWGCGYLETINTGNLPFFLDILSDEECWKKTDTIHGIKLNRRIVAKKMIEPKSWKGTNNPLDDFDRYQIACWCCLEEDIITLFEHFKREDEIKDGDSGALKKLVKSVSGSWYTDAMMQFWSHFVSGYIAELDLKDQHPYVLGLHRGAISMRRKRVEAVEFFWNKIKSLPESELSAQEKDKVFMKIAVHAAHDNGYPDVFEFCLSQINPDRYPELLKRDLEKNGYYGSLGRMLEMFNFDQFQKLFDCLKPSDVVVGSYYCTWLRNIKIGGCSGQYLNVGAKLLMHMLMKDGFDSHRTLALNGEVMNNSTFQGSLLVPLVEKGCMEQVWAILDKTNSKQIEEFMSSKRAGYICSILEQDRASLNKFLSYSGSVDVDLDQKSIPGPSGDLSDVKLNKMHDKSHIRLGE